MITEKKNAKTFAENWLNRGYEKGETQTFWLEFFTQILKIDDATSKIQFEKQVTIDGGTKFIDAYVPETRVLIEQKSSSVNLQRKERQSDGEMLTPHEQAERYASHLVGEENPLWIVVCNFRTIEIYNRRQRHQVPTLVPLADLHKFLSAFDFLTDRSVKEITIEKDISVEAGKIVGALYDKLLAQYKEPDDFSLKSLNALCVRLVFCLYAEDAGLFGKRTAFHDYLNEYKPEQIRKALIELFKTLDTPENQRDKYFADDNPLLARFPYVNGGLFADTTIEIPPFTEEIKQYLLKNASADFDWRNISPTIFGAVFESTLNPVTRRSGGMHYTSSENIHKVIDPLFMDDLYAEFERIEQLRNLKQRRQELAQFQEKISRLKFLDPACGSGNFLTETYISLRRLENKCLRILLDTNSTSMAMDFGDLIKVNIHQFYGIEINDFAVTVAKAALWIAESQMIAETESIVQQNIPFLPLHNYANIVEGNALRVDWRRCFQHRDMGDEMGADASSVRNNLFYNDLRSENYTTLEASSPMFTRGNLPHWHIDSVIQFVTFRLADSLPQKKLIELANEKEQFLLKNPKPWTEQQEREYYKTFGKKIDKWLAAGSGSCVLKQPEIRKIMDDTLQFFNGKRYILHEYAIMPNHVHLLIEPLGENTLPKIMHSIKSFSANEINAALGQSGALWQHESFDRVIRSPYHYDNVVRYIRSNGDEASLLRNIADASSVSNNNTTLEASSPASASSPDYIMGNPPFVGHQYRTPEQMADMKTAFYDLEKHGKLDFVCAWYNKAVDLIQNTDTKCAFVSTNSICQGESVGILWGHLFKKNIQIDFAYRSFIWDSESFLKAHVHCVIVGFSYNNNVGTQNFMSPQNEKIIFDGDQKILAKNINGYLIDAPNVFIEARGKVMTKGLPEMTKGSQPTDGGNLILSEEEKKELINKYPESQKLIKLFIGAEEFINNKHRYCLWLKDVSPIEYINIPPIMQRLERVKEMRLKSPTASVQRDAATPMLFTQIRQPDTDYLIVPRVSSETRKYLPIGFVSHNIIASDSTQFIPNANLYLFGVLTSLVHNAWMRTVAGRLEMRYRYSPAVYNNFPFPTPSVEQKAEIERTAQAILDVRAKYPECSLADMYGEKMFVFTDLVQAHQANDRAVMRAYGFDEKMTENEIVAALFELYNAQL